MGGVPLERAVGVIGVTVPGFADLDDDATLDGDFEAGARC